MNSLEIIGTAKDLRTNTHVLYAQILVNEYFGLIGENYNKFQLQRRKEKHKGYKRLKNDLEKGALIPPITLAIEPIIAKNFVADISNNNKKKVLSNLKKVNDNIYILDGLQRTHLIKDLIDSGVIFNKDHKLLLEIWVEPEITHLVYRLIVLNSGQKPMSMRHQLELLFTTMRVTISKEIKGLELLEEKDESRRSRANQFPFDRVVTSYQSFLRETPEIDKTSVISEKLLEEKLMDESEEFINESFQAFKKYLSLYCQLDFELFRISNNSKFKKYRNWFADANVMNSFFAAVGLFYNMEGKQKRVDIAVKKLITSLKKSPNGVDALNLDTYNKVKSDVADPSQYNVGFITRKLLTRSFQEFFREEGDVALHKFWLQQSIELKK